MNEDSPSVRRVIGPTSAERIRQLELQVKLLCAAMDLRPTDFDELIPKEVFELARGGERVQAVRVLRARGFSLVAGSRVVDAISRHPA